MSLVINIATDYSRFPGGRYPEDGSGNGTDFREHFLVPVLEGKQHATIVLDGAVGYPSSFLDEAFAGLVRVKGFSADQVLKAFDFKAEQPAFRPFIALIRDYVRSAKAMPQQA